MTDTLPYIPDPWQLDKFLPLNMWQDMDKEELAKSVIEMYAYTYRDPQWQRCGTCIHWAYVAAVVMRLSGRRSILQCGSMQWPLGYTAPDGATHFTYLWSPTDPQSRQRIAQNALPEVHCWVALPDTQEILDFSTHQLRAASEELGYPIRGEIPRYLWCKGEDLPADVHYRPELEAIKWVCEFLRRNG